MTRQEPIAEREARASTPRRVVETAAERDAKRRTEIARGWTEARARAAELPERLAARELQLARDH
jgi:hypothetical protein